MSKTLTNRNFSIFVAVLALFFAVSVFAQEAVIKIEAVSHQEIADGELDTTLYKSPSSGLNLVGKGERVYLMGMEKGGEEVTAYTWSIESAPENSTAELDFMDRSFVTFRPDLTGSYDVMLSITTATGTADTTIEVMAGTFVGVGIWTEVLETGTSGCGCHNATVTEWVNSAHPTLFKDGINGVASDHYNEGCIECHTLGYNHDPEAVNGGFDDVQATTGWEFPETPQMGEWDSLVANYPELAKLGSIQCENCHGPANLHLEGSKSGTIAVSINEGVCGACHDEGPYHTKSLEWEQSSHNFDPFVSAHGAGARGVGCYCHSGTAFLEANVESISFNPDDPGNVSCAVCHDPHTATIREFENVELSNGTLLTDGGEGKLCMTCHHGRRDAESYATEYHDHFGPHYSNQADLLFGENYVSFGLVDLSSTTHSKLENACVTCHMAMGPEENALGGHTFAISSDNGTPEDMTDDVDLVDGCMNCHPGVTSFEDFVAKVDFDGNGTREPVQTEVMGMLHNLGMMLPPLGEETVEVDSNYTDTELKAAYNYFYVEEDGSHGVHNLDLAVRLLKVSIDALSPSVVGAGEIVEIKDVPNDQGKQVHVIWKRFNGELVEANPVKEYVLLRLLAEDYMEPENVVKYNSFEEVMSIEEGSALMVGNEVWEYVGDYPALNNVYYSAVAPTVYDSTADGMYMTTFKVVALAENGLTAESDTASGYSVDNLVPMAPEGVSASVIAGKINLIWNESEATDFDYFAVYKSTEQGFVPSEDNRIATTTVTELEDGNVNLEETYYYVIAAYDFSGNQGEFSEELGVTFTSVAGEEGIPTEFALKQNYPNPFNPTTSIKFQLPEASHVSIVIYDAVGREVARLVNQDMGAGYHNLQWNAAGYSSGVYFYRMEASDFVQVNKMLLLK